MRRRLLILDEPFVGCDPASCLSLVRVLRQARAGGTAILIISHQAEVMRHLSLVECVPLPEIRLEKSAPSNLIDVWMPPDS